MKRRTPDDKQNAPLENPVPVELRTPCHPYQARSEAPLVLVAADGSEVIAGRVLYCGNRDWSEGKPKDCKNVYSLKYKEADLPQELFPAAIGKLIKKKSPSTWITNGFHITKLKGEWVSMHHEDLSYTPPYEKESDLTEEALKALRIRQRNPGPIPPRPPDGTVEIPFSLQEKLNPKPEDEEAVAEDIEEPPSFA